MAALNNEEVNLVGSLVSSGSLARWNDYDNNANGQGFRYDGSFKRTQKGHRLHSPVNQCANHPQFGLLPLPVRNPELAVKL